MKRQFCSYEIALKLKELGFDEECIAVYTKYNNNSKTELFPKLQDFSKGYFNTAINSYYEKEKIKVICAPLWQQVIDWFDTKGIFITIRPYYHSTIMKYGWILDHGKLLTGGNFNSRYEATENAIIEAIKLYEIYI